VFYEYIAMVVWTRNAADIGSFLGGAIAGFYLGHISRLISAEIRSKHILAIAVGWAVAWLVRLEVGLSMAELLGESSPISPWIVGDIMKSLVGGIITALVLRRAMPVLPSRVMYLIPIGWGTGFVLGGEIATAVGGQYEPILRYLIFIALNAAISTTIGGGVMFWAISSARPRAAQQETLSTLLPVIGSGVGAMLGAMGGGLIGKSLIGAENGFILGLMLGAIVGAIIGGTIFRQSG
jgi:hypothetical protein